MNVEERQTLDIPHLPQTLRFYRKLRDLDYENGDVFDFKAGGDGDNGEHLMYLLDVLFEEMDTES